jgi:Protein of unknown function (DUF3606)
MKDQQKAVVPDKDKDKIMVIGDAELRAWADRLNVTKAKLKAAVNAAGPSAKAVEAYLDRKK